jgi:uncharacterized OB-fold protein
MRTGTVYTETVVHAAPAALAAEAPYQVAIVELDVAGPPMGAPALSGVAQAVSPAIPTRLTARIHGARVVIGDRVREAAPIDGAPAFEKAVA